MAVQDIINRVQTEIEDATGESDSTWTDADYVLGKLLTVGDDIAIRLQLLDLNYNTQEVILPAIPANTEDLSGYQAAGQPLAEMIIPKTVEWRLAGENQEQWQPVPEVDKVIDTDTGTGLPGSAIESDDPTVESWEYRGGALKISPCEEIVDLRIRFVATAIQLNANSAQQVLGLTNVYVYKVCEKICASRGVGTSGLVEYFRDCYNRACGDFEALSVKTQHPKGMRLGGRRSGSPTGLNTGWKPPIVG
jgi:hypothetical protein